MFVCFVEVLFLGGVDFCFLFFVFVFFCFVFYFYFFVVVFLLLFLKTCESVIPIYREFQPSQLEQQNTPTLSLYGGV